jgi:hypothetical protein
VSEEVWIPLVDEPIGGIVAAVEAANPKIAELTGSPRRLLAFRTFAYIRVGILLGRLLVEEDVAAEEGSATWVEQLLAQPRHRAALEREVLAVAEEIGAEPDDDGELGSAVGDDARERFRAFARAHGS